MSRKREGRFGQFGMGSGPNLGWVLAGQFDLGTHLGMEEWKEQDVPDAEETHVARVLAIIA